MTCCKDIKISEESQAQTCAGCGGPHMFDTSIPSTVWNRVIRANDLPEYLCTSCIVRAFVKAGESFTATLWSDEFNGMPIEVIINGQNAQDATAVQEENNRLRVRVRQLEIDFLKNGQQK